MKLFWGKIFSRNADVDWLIVDGKRIIESGKGTPPQEIPQEHIPGILYPPMTDCHVHFFQTGFSANSIDLSSSKSKTEALELFSEMAKDSPRIGEVIWGWGYECETITASEIDRFVPNAPVLISRIDGHSAYLNSKSLELVPGELKSADGVYKGAMLEKIHSYFLSFATLDDLVHSAKKAAQIAMESGTQYIHALVPKIEWVKILLEISDKLPIEMTIFCETTDVIGVKELGLSQIGGCLLLDGSLGSRTAALKDPYSDEPGNYGILYYSDDELEKFFSLARKYNLRVAMHAIGDEAIEQYVRAAKKVLSGEKASGWRIEHCELVDEKTLEEIARLDINLSVQPVFETLWGGDSGMYSKRLGNRWQLTNPFKTARELGINLLGGSDSYITPIDPINGIVSAMNHPNSLHSLSLNEAISLFTTSPAKWENRQGDGEFKRNAPAKGVILSREISKNTIPQVVGLLDGENLIYFDDIKQR